MKRSATIQTTFCAALAALALLQAPLRAADHGDAPIPSNNQEIDIADVYLFMDPSAGNADNVILIATIRGFIAAGENSNFGIFDPNVRYHFEIENTGDTVADKTIDVTFSPRTAQPGPAPREILQVPQAQTATVTFSKAFKDAGGKKLGSFAGLATTPSSTAEAPPAQVVVPLGTTGISFFAGLVDDPFFFDIPAFGAFIASVRANSPDVSVFNRGRDSFAGYNVMGIALSIPKTFLLGSDGTKIGVAFYAQKQIVQKPSKKTGDLKATGAFKTFDRMATPAVNVALIPFNRKNEYNVATPTDDANLRFGEDILATLNALGTQGADVFPPTDNALVLAQVAVLNGDYLRLDTAVANTGMNGGDNLEAIFPNGRRPKDDVVDILLTLIANGNPFDGFDLGDNVNASDPLPNSTFPFLAQPNQPLPRGGALPLPDTNVDDKTRN